MNKLKFTHQTSNTILIMKFNDPKIKKRFKHTLETTDKKQNNDILTEDVITHLHNFTNFILKP